MAVEVYGLCILTLGRWSRNSANFVGMGKCDTVSYFELDSDRVFCD